MRLSPFGEAVRMLRMRYDIPMKSMARALQISSSYLSGIEYGDRNLADKHVQGAVDFFRGVATETELDTLRNAAEASKDVVNVAGLKPDKRGLVAAFARQLEAGKNPTKALEDVLRHVSENSDDHR